MIGTEMTLVLLALYILAIVIWYGGLALDWW